MSRRNKLQKFAENLSFPNVFENFDPKNPELIGQNGEVTNLRGNWRSVFFQNENPLVVELACGRGEYTLGLARQFSNKNFIGADVKGARIWKGARAALDENLSNVAFLRTRIEVIAAFFEPGEVDEIWITFPDPFLRESKSNRRLTSPVFLSQFAKILKPGALIHLKTDEPNLFEFTLETLSQSPDYQLIYSDSDIYAKPLFTPELALRTYYEHQHLANGKTIKYVRFKWLGA